MIFKYRCYSTESPASCSSSLHRNYWHQASSSSLTVHNATNSISNDYININSMMIHNWMHISSLFLGLSVVQGFLAPTTLQQRSNKYTVSFFQKPNSITFFSSSQRENNNLVTPLHVLYSSKNVTATNDEKDSAGNKKVASTSTPATASATSNTVVSATAVTDESVKTRGKVPIRFINYEGMNGPERLAYAIPGTNILKIADEAGIRIPRQCRSGLCGSCTADVKDPTWTEGERIGYQTVRTCQAGAMLPAGCNEMIVDCFRMSSSSSNNNDPMDPVNMMASLPNNFEDGWENSFTPDYKTSTGSGGIQVLKTSTPEYTVKQGMKSSIEIEKPHWTPRIDANIPPWETIW